jgi:hypothetical protein
MPHLEQTLNELIKLASEHFQVPVNELNPDEDFFKKLKINSLKPDL